MKQIFEYFLIMLFLFVDTKSLSAQGSQSLNPVDGQKNEDIIQKFVKDSLQMDDIVFKYGLFIPENPKPGIKYPLVLAIHGGEYYNVNFAEFMSTSPFILATVWATPELQSRYPCYIFAPHLDNNLVDNSGNCFMWEDSLVIIFIDTVLNDLITKEQVDTNRIYLTGHSVGGEATLLLPQLLKHKIAAISPMSPALWPAFVEQHLSKETYKNLPD